jgi:hypothetical protein
MLEKILGMIDLLAGFCFLLMMFSITPLAAYLLFCAGLLLVKSLFIFGGDILSWIDLVSGTLLLASLVIHLNVLFLWLPTFLLISKAIASFI